MYNNRPAVSLDAIIKRSNAVYRKWQYYYSFSISSIDNPVISVIRLKSIPFAFI